MADAAAAEQLRQYLFELKPQARALLVTELERAALRGEAPPGTVAILEQLRETARQRGDKLPRVGNASRLFFSFAEPFLVGGTSQRKWIGRIPRASLDPIWNWICRDLMPIEAQTYTERVDRHLAANETGDAELMASAFQDLAGHRLHECLASGSDDRALRRIAVQIGTPHALDETRELATILRIRDALGVIGSRLPASINNLTEDQLANAGALLRSQIARPRDVFVHAVLIVRSRLASPWQLIRLAVQAAGTDVAARVAATPYAIAVDIALNDIDLLIGSLHNALKRQSDDVADLLKQIHDAVRGLRTEVDFPADAAWGRQLASARAEASTLLQGEIENVPSHVRRLLRARDAREFADRRLMQAMSPRSRRNSRSSRHAATMRASLR